MPQKLKTFVDAAENCGIKWKYLPDYYEEYHPYTIMFTNVLDSEDRGAILFFDENGNLTDE